MNKLLVGYLDKIIREINMGYMQEYRQGRQIN